MKIIFKELEIGDKFEQNFGVSYPYKDEKIIRYKKVSKSKALCFHQQGMGNTRMVDNLYTFAPYKEVKKIEVKISSIKKRDLIYSRLYKGGGGYKTSIDGHEITIDKQYGSNTWQVTCYDKVFGPNGDEYMEDIETTYLDSVKDTLESVAKEYYESKNLKSSGKIDESNVKLYFDVPKHNTLKDSPYNKFIGQTFMVKGYNEPRKVRIEEVYGSKSKPSFRTTIIGDYSHFKDGERENFFCTSVVKNGQLVKLLKVLSA